MTPGERIVDGEPLYSAAWVDMLQDSLREPRGDVDASAPTGSPPPADGAAGGSRRGASLSVLHVTPEERAHGIRRSLARGHE